MNKRDWMIAAPVLAALAACMAAFLHGVNVENSVGGIAAMRALETPAGARMAVVAAGALHVLDAQGQRLARQDLGAIGLRGVPNDMDLTLDAAGGLEAWFFDDWGSQPRVMRCVWSEQARALQQCRVAAEGAHLKWTAASRAVHLAVDRLGERLFVADAKSARVQAFSLDGKRLASSEPSALPLNFPNRLRYLRGDDLVVADNDHRRLVWTRVRPGTPAQLVSTLYAEDHPQSRGGRTKVTDAAFGRSGSLWMVAVKQGQKDGDVLVFDAARKPVARAQLPSGADPLIVESLGDTAVVADYSLVSLHHLDLSGRYLGEFGGAAFKAELLPQRERSRQARLWTRGAMGLGAAVLVLGFVLAWRFGSRPVPVRHPPLPPGAQQPEPPLRFPVVLQPTAAWLSNLRKLLWVAGALALCSVALVSMTAGTGAPVPSWHARLQFALVALTSVVAFLILLREARQPAQLRVSATRVGVFRAERCIAQSLIADTYICERSLLIGTRLVSCGAAPGHRSTPPKYDPELLDRALIFRLPPGHRVGSLSILWLWARRLPFWRR